MCPRGVHKMGQDRWYNGTLEIPEILSTTGGGGSITGQRKCYKGTLKLSDIF